MSWLFGSTPRESKKKQRSRTSRESNRKGKVAEGIVKERYEMAGWKMERTGEGHDFKATRKNLLGRVVETRYVEVKSGKSRQSKLQKQEQAKRRGHYKVEHENPAKFLWKDW